MAARRRILSSFCRTLMVANGDNEIMQQRELVIEKLVYGGDGLARHNGQVILVPFVLPGERVRVVLEPAQSQMLRASLTDIIEPSPHRAEPRCPYFGRCGGCHYQHISYEFQVEQKKAILLE